MVFVTETQHSDYIELELVGTQLKLIVRECDGFFNGTKFCQAFKKTTSHFHEIKSTKDVLLILRDEYDYNTMMFNAKDLGIGAKSRLPAGKYYHPVLLLLLAWWCDKPLYVQVAIVIKEFFSRTSERRQLYAKLMQLHKLESFEFNTEHKVARVNYGGYDLLIDRQGWLNAEQLAAQLKKNWRNFERSPFATELIGNLPEYLNCDPRKEHDLSDNAPIEFFGTYYHPLLFCAFAMCIGTRFYARISRIILAKLTDEVEAVSNNVELEPREAPQPPPSQSRSSIMEFDCDIDEDDDDMIMKDEPINYDEVYKELYEKEEEQRRGRESDEEIDESSNSEYAKVHEEYSRIIEANAQECQELRAKLLQERQEKEELAKKIDSLTTRVNALSLDNVKLSVTNKELSSHNMKLRSSLKVREQEPPRITKRQKIEQIHVKLGFGKVCATVVIRLRDSPNTLHAVRRQIHSLGATLVRNKRLLLNPNAQLVMAFLTDNAITDFNFCKEMVRKWYDDKTRDFVLKMSPSVIEIVESDEDYRNRDLEEYVSEPAGEPHINEIINLVRQTLMNLESIECDVAMLSDILLLCNGSLAANHKLIRTRVEKRIKSESDVILFQAYSYIYNATQEYTKRQFRRLDSRINKDK